MTIPEAVRLGRMLFDPALAVHAVISDEHGDDGSTFVRVEVFSTTDLHSSRPPIAHRRDRRSVRVPAVIGRLVQTTTGDDRNSRDLAVADAIAQLCGELSREIQQREATS